MMQLQQLHLDKLKIMNYGKDESTAGNFAFSSLEAATKALTKNKIDVFDCDKEIATFYNKNDTIIEIKKIFPSHLLELF